MDKQRWEESERRRKEVRRSERRKSEKKEDAGARKGRKVTIHCVFPMICGSIGSKTERFGPLFDVQMSKKCTLTNLTNLTNLTHLTHYTTRHYTTLRYITLPYTTLHYTTL